MNSNKQSSLSSTQRETLDGVFLRVDKVDLDISFEKSDQTQQLPGYELSIKVPQWDINRDLLVSVDKAYRANHKFLTKLDAGACIKRDWMMKRFDEAEKATATALTVIAERIRTRRWRENDRHQAFTQLRTTFDELIAWAAKTDKYCTLARQCSDPDKQEMYVDAASLALLKVGEGINRIEQMQHGFWHNFGAEHFLELRHIRNQICHTDELDGTTVLSLGTGIIRELHTALTRTQFQEEGAHGGFQIANSELHSLERARPGKTPKLNDSIPVVRFDEKKRFFILRLALTEENQLLISSSEAERVKFKVWYISES